MKTLNKKTFCQLNFPTFQSTQHPSFPEYPPSYWTLPQSLHSSSLFHHQKQNQLTAQSEYTTIPKVQSKSTYTFLLSLDNTNKDIMFSYLQFLKQTDITEFILIYRYCEYLLTEQQRSELTEQVTRTFEEEFTLFLNQIHSTSIQREEILIKLKPTHLPYYLKQLTIPKQNDSLYKYINYEGKEFYSSINLIPTFPLQYTNYEQIFYMFIDTFRYLIYVNSDEGCTFNFSSFSEMCLIIYQRFKIDYDSLLLHKLAIYIYFSTQLLNEEIDFLSFSFQLMSSIGLESSFYNILNKYYPDYSQRNTTISLIKQTLNDNCYYYNYIPQFKPLIEEHVMLILNSNCIRTMCLDVYKDVTYSNYIELILGNINYFGFCDSMCLNNAITDKFTLTMSVNISKNKRIIKAKESKLKFKSKRCLLFLHIVYWIVIVIQEYLIYLHQHGNFCVNGVNVDDNGNEDVLELMFGNNCFFNFSFSQMMFIITRSSYDYDYMTFKNKFMSIKNTQLKTMNEIKGNKSDYAFIKKVFKLCDIKYEQVYKRLTGRKCYISKHMKKK